MVEIPIYLKDYTIIKKKAKDIIVLQVVCPCGCLSFYLMENFLDSEEEKDIEAYERKFSKWHNIENYTDPDTKIRYLVTRNIFGKIYDKIPLCKVQDIKRTHIEKIKCSDCGAEKVIYDNRCHGYTAIFDKKLRVDKEYRYVLVQKKSMEVEIKLRNELSYEEYCEEVEDAYLKNLSNFSNAFSSIEIYGITNGKRKKFFEEETA